MRRNNPIAPVDDELVAAVRWLSEGEWHTMPVELRADVMAILCERCLGLLAKGVESAHEQLDAQVRDSRRDIRRDIRRDGIAAETSLAHTHPRRHVAREREAPISANIAQEREATRARNAANRAQNDIRKKERAQLRAAKAELLTWRKACAEAWRVVEQRESALKQAQSAAHIAAMMQAR